MSDFLLATFLFIVYMCFVSWGLSSNQLPVALGQLPENSEETVQSHCQTAPTMADYAYAFAVEPELEPNNQLLLNSQHSTVKRSPQRSSYCELLTEMTEPDPWESSTCQPFENWEPIVALHYQYPKPNLLLPPAPESAPNIKNLPSKSKVAPTQAVNRFSAMNTRQLKKEASAWNKRNPKQKIKNLGSLNKAQLVESLVAFWA